MTVTRRCPPLKRPLTTRRNSTIGEERHTKDRYWTMSETVDRLLGAANVAEL
jgi:hypothetical protein